MFRLPFRALFALLGVYLFSPPPPQIYIFSSAFSFILSLALTGTAAAVEHKMALGGFGYQFVRDGRAEGDPIGFSLVFFSPSGIMVLLSQNVVSERELLRLRMSTLGERLTIRACLKIVNTPNRRASFRRAALLCLEIHKVFLRQIALPGEKIPCRWAYCQFSNGA